MTKSRNELWARCNYCLDAGLQLYHTYLGRLIQVRGLYVEDLWPARKAIGFTLIIERVQYFDCK